MRSEGAQAEHNERIRIGAALADQLPKAMSAKEAAAKLGISTQALRIQECLALYKLQKRLREIEQQLNT